LPVLAGAYLFTAFLAAAHALTFPGLFAPGGLLGSGPQTTAWLYMIWHAGFPLAVIAYAQLRKSPVQPAHARMRFGPVVIATFAAVLVAAAGATFLATAGRETLPAIMDGNHYTPAMVGVVSSVWALSAVALVCLWWPRQWSILDLWLMAVMCAWLFDVALSAVLNAGRFDLGFYAGRIYGLLAASFVLVVLLLENGELHARLAARTTELEAANKELESFSYSVSHDLRVPLRAIDGYSQMLEEDYAPALDAEGRRLLHVIRENSRRMGALIDDLLAFSRLGRKPIASSVIDMNALVAEVLKELRSPAATNGPITTIANLPAAYGDRTLLKQVWVNLLSNALKFGGKSGAPQIEVNGINGGAETVYSVKDNGVGFDMQYYGKLFSVFQRLHRQDEFPGTGVGLAIVQRVVTRHGGRVWAEGQIDQGATFHFALPMRGAR